MKTNKKLCRHLLLPVVYALLVLESIYHFFSTDGRPTSLWVEFVIGIAIAASYYFAVHVYEKWLDRAAFRVMVDRIHSGIAIMRKDESLTLLRANRAFFRINGYSMDEFQEMFDGKCMQVIFADDRPVMREAIGKLNVDRVHAHADFRIKSKDGTIKWLHMDTFLFQQDGKEPVLQSIFTDISALRASMERADMEAKRYFAIAQLSDDVLFDYGIADKTMTMVRPISDIYAGKTAIVDFYDDAIANHVIPKADEKAIAVFRSGAVSNTEKIREEFRVRSSDDTFTWYRMEGTVLQNQSGVPCRIVGKFTNIDEQKREKEELTQRLQRDPMTGILNKVVTQKLIERYLVKARDDEVSALFVLDMDNFKHINDALGHLSGDRVLTYIAQNIKHTMRSSDIFGRVGGDEFLVFVKNIHSRMLAAQKAEQFCKIFRSSVLENELHYVVSGSIGIAMFPDDGRTYRELFEKADRALYMAKGQGKDGFSFYHPAEDECAAQLQDQQMVVPSPRSLPVPFVNQGIVDNLLTFMNEHCLDPNAMEQMLGLVCQYYQVSRGRLLEFSDDGEKIERIYEWHAQGFAADSNRLLAYSRAFWEMYVRQFDKNAVFQCASLQKAGITPAGERDLSSMQHLMVSHQRPSSILMLDDVFSQNQITFHELSVMEIVHSLLQYDLALMQNLRVSQELVNIDALTGVHTYESFHSVLRTTLLNDPDARYVLISCDINRFSEINDLIGHDQADQVLVSFTSVIQRHLEQDEQIGRVSADIFCILIHGDERSALLDRLEQWDQVFRKEVEMFHIPSNVQVAVGLYAIRAGSDTPSAMFDRANAARKLAKSSRERMVCFYDDKLHEKILYEKDMESYMISSLEKNEFLIYLQPKFNLTDRKIAGAEALVRWNHPTRGFVSPGDFIPLFEKNHFVVELDFFVLESVCRMLRRWMNEGRPVVPIAVNFSRVHLLTDDFVPRILGVVEKYNIPPFDLEIELTESAYISRFHNVLQVAQELRQHGFLMAMDDFGAGYSSLNSLKNLPLDILKLDKNFFQEKEPTPKETIIIENIVRLAKQLDLCVVSEGVELEWQAEFLCSVDCDLVQGYLFSRPLPVPTFEKILMEHAQPLLHYPPES